MSSEAIQADLDAGKDFLVADGLSGGGGYVTKAELLAKGVTSVTVRYKALRSVTVLKLSAK